MADIKLTCAETPLAWPSSVSLDNLTVCGTCGIKITAPNPGTLKVSSRRSGVGDGVDVEEDFYLSGADYRGQQYKIKEAIFHTPGLHVFPGQSGVYPAEYHLHMDTLSEPIRSVTLVIPASHLVAENSATKAYFAAIKQEPDATVARPTLESLMAAVDSAVLQFQGPDLRGRVYDTGDCNATGQERQFLLVLKPAFIRASDLERIPREGSRSIDPRDLPAPGVEPKIKAISVDRLKKTMVLAKPGILYATSAGVKKSGPELRLLDGSEIVDICGESVTLKSLLGGEKKPAVGATSANNDAFVMNVMLAIIVALGSFIGFILADWVCCTYIWPYFLIEGKQSLSAWNIYKKIFVLFIFAAPLVYALMDSAEKTILS